VLYTAGVRCPGRAVSRPDLVLVDDPAEHVRRLTLNRPEKRNALSNSLRRQLFDALRAADDDATVHVVVIRGAGPCFSAGYDLKPDPADPPPWWTPGGDGMWPRHVLQGWFEIWDLATPVIAQVHGWCLAGGSELATACDLVYVADDARIGYPPVRSMTTPDMQYHPWLMGMRAAMEQMLTGDAMTGTEAARVGWANRSHPADELEGQVLDVARRVAGVPPDLQQLNKRAVHRAMETMGVRTALRAGSEILALGLHQRSSREYMDRLRAGELTPMLDERDRPFGDYRTSVERPEA
jgi:enoyl-CoA hydratase